MTCSPFRFYEDVLLHAVRWIPGSVQLAYEEHLADVISVVRADVGDVGGVLLQIRLGATRNVRLQIRKDLIKVFLRLCPVGGVESIEGLIVVAIELGYGLAGHLCELFPIPEDQVIGELADGVIAGAVSPGGLLRSESGNGIVGWDKPFFAVVGRFELRQQNRAQGGWSLRFLRLCQS